MVTGEQKKPRTATTDAMVNRWSSIYPEMVSDWEDNLHGQTYIWEEKFQSLKSEMEAVRARGQWRSGKRTLLEILGFNTKELLMCRALEWLFQPEGWHGLDDDFAIAFFKRFGIKHSQTNSILTSREEFAGSTRADLVIRAGEVTVVIEAKIFAGEGNKQCDRIAAAWENENPVLIFLSKAGDFPVTAIESSGRWKAVAWRELGLLLKATIAARKGQSVADGLYELAEVWSKEGNQT